MKIFQIFLLVQIVNFDEGLLPVSLLAEDPSGTHQPKIGLQSEGVFADVALEGELRELFGDVDFIVYIPADVDAELVRAEIDKYKKATARYRIVQTEP